jgi:hypothetical protein
VQSGIRPNHVQLLHLQRPRRVDDPCDTCGAGYTDRPTHWRVRANLVLEDGSWQAIVGNYCGEECARYEYNALRIEIALITGKKPTRREVMFDQVAGHQNEDKSAKEE